jgi:hypothetical protein
LRFHKARGQNYVVLNGKAIYCGQPGDPAAEPRYHQAIGEWLAAGRQLPADPTTLTIKELLARFWTHAEQYYRTLTDGRIKELEQYRLALRPLKELYADTPAADFGPRALKAVRLKMIDHGLVQAIHQQAGQPYGPWHRLSDVWLPSSTTCMVLGIRWEWTARR